jgi:DNA-directed RNA polymerase specialized sigma24 family protein
MSVSRDAHFRAVYDGNLAEVNAYVRRRAAEDAVEDIVADVFLVCWKKLEQVPTEPLPWLYAVARKRLANHYRHRARQAVALPSRAVVGEVPLPSDPILALAFGRLAETDREVLRLVAWEQLTLRQAAAALDCSAVACRVRLHRAKRRLADHLEQLEAASAVPRPHPDPRGATP